METIKRVRCPSVIIHGWLDEMVQYEDSIEMLINGFTNTQAHLFIRDKMQHQYVSSIWKRRQNVRLNLKGKIFKTLSYSLRGLGVLKTLIA